MANKLSNLKITSADLVQRGANPDAHIRLFKRKDNDEPPETLLQKCVAAIYSVFAKTLPDDGEALPDDGEALPDDGEALAKAVDGGDEGDGAGHSRMENEKEEGMKIDKTRMTPEEQAVFAEFEKKYGVENGAEGTEVHPEVRKALLEMEEVRKAQSAEIEALKKSLEIERLTGFAKKYEIIGKKAEELAPKLHELKKAGGTAFDDYVALLDEHLTTVEKSGLFGEVGKNTGGSADADAGICLKAAELTKTGDLSGAEAIAKAFENNPDLAKQYEKEYSGRDW